MKRTWAQSKPPSTIRGHQHQRKEQHFDRPSTTLELKSVATPSAQWRRKLSRRVIVAPSHCNSCASVALFAAFVVQQRGPGWHARRRFVIAARPAMHPYALSPNEICLPIVDVVMRKIQFRWNSGI